MDIVGSLVIALVVPLVWGVGSAWAFDRLRERREAARRRKGNLGAESEP
ncbi:MAG: hypothetical protein JXA74_06815 [Anaerolineae bacterium]|nr:hypothetical protein [Anaerolineae bacterium]